MIAFPECFEIAQVLPLRQRKRIIGPKGDKIRCSVLPPVREMTPMRGYRNILAQTLKSWWGLQSEHSACVIGVLEPRGVLT